MSVTSTLKDAKPTNGIYTWGQMWLVQYANPKQKATLYDVDFKTTEAATTYEIAVVV